jgi:hypothetical protein
MPNFFFLLTHPRHRFDKWSDGSHRESFVFQNVEIVKNSDAVIAIENSNGQQGDQFASVWKTLSWEQIQFKSCEVRIVNADKCFIGQMKNEWQDEEKKMQDGILVHRSFHVEVGIHLPNALFSRLTTIDWKDQGIHLHITNGISVFDREEFKLPLDENDKSKYRRGETPDPDELGGFLFIKGDGYDMITYPLVQDTPGDSE